MRFKSILASMLAMAAFVSCTKDNGPVNPEVGDGTAAYLSVTVVTPYGTGTRAGTGSTEEDATTGEATITDLYILTFKSGGNLVKHSLESNYYLHLTSADFTDKTGPVEYKTKAVRVSGDAMKALLIANPGTELLNVINNLYAGMTFDEINAAVALEFQRNSAQKPETLVDEIRNLAGNKDVANDASYSYFTMINSEGLLDIQNYVVKIAGTITTDEQASTAAEAKPVKVGIERLTAKVEVIKAGTVTFVGGTGAVLDAFWTLDVLNSAFFPYAEKFQMNAANHETGTYFQAFYTKDPNYLLAAATNGLTYNTLCSTDMAPHTTFLKSGAVDYAIENTMEAKAMLYQNVTRVVVKALYRPDNGWYEPKESGVVGSRGGADADWFRYGAVNYDCIEYVIEDLFNYVENDGENISRDENAFKIKEIYAGREDVKKFVAACERFEKAINEWVGEGNYKFEELTTDNLTGYVPENGGEIVKDTEGCIRWYQGGLNYYYYEIRHDNTQKVDGVNGDYEYGVVRNNWYSLTLTKINGHGTPWYPAVNPNPDVNPDPYPGDEDDPSYPDPKPDPDDPFNPTPDPDDPIEESAARISFEVTVKPWIKWVNEIEL